MKEPIEEWDLFDRLLTLLESLDESIQRAIS